MWLLVWRISSLRVNLSWLLISRFKLQLYDHYITLVLWPGSVCLLTKIYRCRGTVGCGYCYNGTPKASALLKRIFVCLHLLFQICNRSSRWRSWLDYKPPERDTTYKSLMIRINNKINVLLSNECDEFSIAFLTTAIKQLNREKETLLQIDTRISYQTYRITQRPQKCYLWSRDAILDKTTKVRITRSQTARSKPHANINVKW